MKVLVDNNLPLSLGIRLRERGIEATHVREIGHRDSADTTIMRLAFDRGEVVLTQDNDFPQLLALSKANGPSVVLLRPGAPLEPDEIASLLARLSESTIHALTDGAVVVVDGRGERIRRLPLR